MMHGLGKSDSAIVAMKPANEAQERAEESVERRAGAKGNAVEQSTCRTLGRESVTQAFGRIRQLARKSEMPSQPKAGAVCLNWARTDLSGGRPVMGVPTAIAS
jgi:hypothetical protein